MLPFLTLLSTFVTFRLPTVPGDALTFTQRLDHFNPTDSRTFSQRYILDRRYSTSPLSNIVIYINCNSAITGSDLTGGPLYSIANRTSALLVFLELRFYGDSFPLPPETENLVRYHTIAQTLADLEAFISDLRGSQCSSKQRCRVLLIGGFFAGNLVAYARMKFPHLVDYAWSSSSLFSFDRDHFLYNALADTALITDHSIECEVWASAVTEKIAAGLNKSGLQTSVTQKLNFTEPVCPQSVMYIVINSISDVIQFYTRSGGRDLNELCSAISSWSNGSFYPWFLQHVPRPNRLDPFQWENWSDSESADSRSWLWQSCSEVGWFRTQAFGTYSYRNLSIDYFKTICRGVFHREMVSEASQAILQRRYGNYPLNVSNLIFSCGLSDPWTDFWELPRLENDRSERVTFFIKTGSHCSDLCVTLPTDSSELVEARATIVDLAVDWLSNECLDKCRNGKCVLGRCICDDNYEGDMCPDRTVTQAIWKSLSSVLLVLPTAIVIAIGIGGWMAFSQEKRPDNLHRL
jgi:hypothetical protein